MDLYVADRSFNKLGTVNNRTSLRWVRRYRKTGEFEIHCPATTQNIEKLQRGNVIIKPGDPEAGYIKYRNLQENDEGKELLVVKGDFLTGYLNRRIIWGIEIINGLVEVAMRNLVNKNAISPTDTNRIIPGLSLGDLKNYTEMADFQTSYQNLTEELERLCALSDIGYRIRYDGSTKSMKFETYKGLDRSSGQSINPRCIFSKNYNNVEKQEFTESDGNYRNLVLIGGIGEGTDRKFATVGTAAGLDRYEIFNDQKSLSNVVDSVTLTDAEYQVLLQGKGNETLTQNKKICVFDSSIDVNANRKYKEDYDLGDIVTNINKKWGVKLDTRIEEIEEVYEEDGEKINVVFGDEAPTLIDKIKQINRQTSSSGGSSSIVISSIDGGIF
ncbi:MAG: siphovirus ReqiPepy6 Gp37-like family protein [Acetobacterium woodii]|nr:siphovirus ReqiPepy6 Gp37-like family protein [Acetobacterium woodii]